MPRDRLTQLPEDHDQEPSFRLANDPPARKQTKYRDTSGKQLRLLSGDEGYLTGQKDLFEHDGLKETS